jgi:hypothetical protein
VVQLKWRDQHGNDQTAPRIGPIRSIEFVDSGRMIEILSIILIGAIGFSYFQLECRRRPRSLFTSCYSLRSYLGIFLKQMSCCATVTFCVWAWIVYDNETLSVWIGRSGRRQPTTHALVCVCVSFLMRWCIHSDIPQVSPTHSSFHPSLGRLASMPTTSDWAVFQACAMPRLMQSISFTNTKSKQK